MMENINNPIDLILAFFAVSRWISCGNLLRELPDGVVDAIIADPLFDPERQGRHHLLNYVVQDLGRK